MSRFRALNTENLHGARSKFSIFRRAWILKLSESRLGFYTRMHENSKNSDFTVVLRSACFSGWSLNHPLSDRVVGIDQRSAADDENWILTFAVGCNESRDSFRLISTLRSGWRGRLCYVLACTLEMYNNPNNTSGLYKSSLTASAPIRLRLVI